MNTQRSRNLKSFMTLGLLIIALLSVFGVAAQDTTPAPATGEPIYIGVSGPLTGALAQYGEQ